ncbi:MAG: ABC transporter [Alphaproteobacteria bacterium]|nr:ABC transporter [Alphaproteobacteria bacterium]
MIRQILNRKGGWVISIAVALGLFVALNAGLSGVTGVRIDLTQDRLYTLSDGTKRILDRVKEPVALEFYISQRLVKEVAIYGNYAGRVRDVINEFAAASNGRVTIAEFDPEPFSETEDLAVAAGVNGVPIDSGGEKVYFGLVARSGGRTGVIGFFQPQRESFLEYDLARMLDGLINPKKPVIGVVTSLPMFGQFRPQPGQPKRWFIVDAMEERFDVRNIFDVQTDLTDDIDVLFLVHPVNMSDEDLYAIDQFLMRRGRAFIMIDPNSELAQGSMAAGRPLAPAASDVNKLMTTWGVSMADKKAAGDMNLARIVNAGTDGNMKPAPYLLWLTVKDAAINSKDAVTRDINAVNIGSGGVIEVAENAPLTVEPLLSTTGQSQAFDVGLINPRAPNILDFVEKFKPGGKNLILSARVTGIADTAFPDGRPEPKKPEKVEPKDAKPAETKPEDADKKEEEKPPTEPEKKYPPHIAKSQAPINVILVTDTDMMQEHFWVRVQDFFGKRVALPFANNGDFIINALENLAGSGDLITLRSRGTAQRPFSHVEALRIEADRKFRAREQTLAKRLQEVQAKFEAAQTKAEGKSKEGEAVLTADQQKALDDEMENLRTDLIAIRKELRAVQLDLRKDIEALDTTLRFLNIGLVPLLVGLFAIGLGIVRVQRRKAAVQT